MSKHKYFKWQIGDFAWAGVNANWDYMTFEDGSGWSRQFMGFYIRYR